MLRNRYMLINSEAATGFFSRMMMHSEFRDAETRFGLSGRSRFIGHFVGMYLRGKCFAYINPVVTAYQSDPTMDADGACGTFIAVRPESVYSAEAHEVYPEGKKAIGLPVTTYHRVYARVIDGRYYLSPFGVSCVSLSVRSYTGLVERMVLSGNDVLKMQYRMISESEFDTVSAFFTDDRVHEAYRLHLGDGRTVDYMARSYDSAAMEYNLENNGGMCVTDSTPPGVSVALYSERPEMKE